MKRVALGKERLKVCFGEKWKGIEYSKTVAALSLARSLSMQGAPFDFFVEYEATQHENALLKAKLARYEEETDSKRFRPSGAQTSLTHGTHYGWS